MKAKAAVLTKFNEPLEMREFPVSPLAAGEALIKIEAAGVCGSDVHMWRGRDPRTPVPIILGHEGVGRIAQIGGSKKDVFGRDLKEGDRVVWERGIMCGKCFYCVIKKQPALCLERKTYGISVSCKEPPHFRGCYAEYLHLMAGAHIIRLDEPVDPKVLVAATCAGATAAHAMELAAIEPGSTVVILGRGPVGLFVLAFSFLCGATQVIILGSKSDSSRLDLCKRLGATEVMTAGDTTLEERVQRIRERTNGLGADVVFECVGTRSAAEEGVKYVRPCGKYLVLGVSTPVGNASLSVFEDLVRKNVSMQGVWVSDTSHLYRAVRLVMSKRFPFESLVTHTLPLTRATEGLEKIENREAVKAVIVP